MREFPGRGPHYQLRAFAKPELDLAKRHSQPASSDISWSCGKQPTALHARHSLIPTPSRR